MIRIILIVITGLEVNASGSEGVAVKTVTLKERDYSSLAVLGGEGEEVRVALGRENGLIEIVDVGKGTVVNQTSALSHIVR